MSLAAATYDSQPQETLMVPDGGIAAFLNATEGDWATDDIPHTGIAQVRHIADRLAEYGRYEDEFMVHAAEGETVIPLEVLEANPRLKSNLFSQMEKMGLEPERYVVGSELNSLNPVTGQPEFFLKKLFKGVKKLVKKVVKVVKKALPIVLPIALAMTPLGPIFGAATGSGIGTLAAGGDLKDALKAGLTAGALGGMFTGVTGGIQSLRAGNTFAAGFKSSVGSAAGGIGERFKQFASPGRVSEAGGTYFGDPTRAITSPDQARALQLSQKLPPITPPPELSVNQLNTGDRLGQTVTDPYTTNLGRDVVTVTDLPPKDPFAITYDPKQVNFVTPTTGGITDATGGITDATVVANLGPESYAITPQAETDKFIADMYATPYTGTAPYGAGVGGVDPNLRTLDESTKFQRARDYLVRGGKTPAEIRLAEQQARQTAVEGILSAYAPGTTIANAPLAVQEAAIAAGEQAFRTAGPGTLAKYGPSALLASGIAAGTGFFDAPEEEEDETEILKTGADLLAEDPEKYMIRYPSAPTYTLSDITVPGYGVGYASGGDVDPSQFPRRNGGIAGPGTETSDDVPAMLSDGEFVMTAKAVKGAGNGSRNNGMQTMYGLMRKFERAAV